MFLLQPGIKFIDYVDVCLQYKCLFSLAFSSSSTVLVSIEAHLCVINSQPLL